MEPLTASRRYGILLVFIFIFIFIFILFSYYKNLTDNHLLAFLFVQIRGRPGDAFVFNGSLWHRGYTNLGFSHRFFYYASFACRPDVNSVVN